VGRESACRRAWHLGAQGVSSIGRFERRATDGPTDSSPGVTFLRPIGAATRRVKLRAQQTPKVSPAPHADSDTYDIVNCIAWRLETIQLRARPPWIVPTDRTSRLWNGSRSSDRRRLPSCREIEFTSFAARTTFNESRWLIQPSHDPRQGTVTVRLALRAATSSGITPVRRQTDPCRRLT
jgi:hypothetical protein